MSNASTFAESGNSPPASPHSGTTLPAPSARPTTLAPLTVLTALTSRVHAAVYPAPSCWQASLILCAIIRAAGMQAEVRTCSVFKDAEKVGARVMVLRNSYNEAGHLIYANGDTGVVKKIDSHGVEILRDDGETRLIKTAQEDNCLKHLVQDADGSTSVYIDKAPTADVLYMPLAQAWATTVHKAQGLTFNHTVCVDLFGNEKPGGNFYGHPAMVYVAVSRVRNPKDLTIVGANCLSQSQSGLTLLEANCNMDGKCRRWL